MVEGWFQILFCLDVGFLVVNLVICLVSFVVEFVWKIMCSDRADCSSSVVRYSVEVGGFDGSISSSV